MITGSVAEAEEGKREAGCISFCIAMIKDVDQKQLEGGEGFISAHGLQSTIERSQGRNSGT